MICTRTCAFVGRFCCFLSFTKFLNNVERRAVSPCCEEALIHNYAFIGAVPVICRERSLFSTLNCSKDVLRGSWTQRVIDSDMQSWIDSNVHVAIRQLLRLLAEWLADLWVGTSNGAESEWNIARFNRPSRVFSQCEMKSCMGALGAEGVDCQ